MKTFRFIKKITQEEVDDIMCTALESGITYWCSKVYIKDKTNVEDTDWVHEVISKGGSLVLVDTDTGKKKILTLKKFLKALSKYDNFNYDDYDAIDADAIVQIAVFGEVIYS